MTGRYDDLADAVKILSMAVVVLAMAAVLCALVWFASIHVAPLMLWIETGGYMR